jgi:hypothetical protein
MKRLLRVLALVGATTRFRPEPGRLNGVNTDRFDIVAKADGTPSRTDMHLMLRRLLIDRFTVRTFFTAMRKQLGLRLEPTKAPVDVPVIDAEEKPTPD